MTMDYFSLLGLEKRFDIDLTLLDSNHLKLQRVVHPDNFANHSTVEKVAAVKQMSLINDGYQLIKNPYQRGLLLLSEAGWEKPDEQVTIKSPQILMQQMSLREQFEEIKSLHQPHTQLENFFDDIDDLMDEQTKQLTELFQKIETVDHEKIYEELVRYKYFMKLKQEIIKFEEYLDDQEPVS